MRQSHTLTVVATADSKDSADFISPTGSSRPPRPPVAGSKSNTGAKPSSSTAPTTAPPSSVSGGTASSSSASRHPAPTAPRAPRDPGSAADSNFATEDWDELESSSELDSQGITNTNVRIPLTSTAAGKRSASGGAQAKGERSFSGPAPVTATAGVRQDENWLNEDFDD